MVLNRTSLVLLVLTTTVGLWQTAWCISDSKLVELSRKGVRIARSYFPALATSSVDTTVQDWVALARDSSSLWGSRYENDSTSIFNAGAVTCYALGDWIAAAKLLSTPRRAPGGETQNPSDVFAWADEHAKLEGESGLKKRIPLDRGSWQEIRVPRDTRRALSVRASAGRELELEPLHGDHRASLVPERTRHKLCDVLTDSVRKESSGELRFRLPWPYGRWRLAIGGRYDEEKPFVQYLNVHSGTRAIRLARTSTVRVHVVWPRGIPRSNVELHSQEYGVWLPTRPEEPGIYEVPYGTYLVQVTHADGAERSGLLHLNDPEERSTRLSMWDEWRLGRDVVDWHLGDGPISVERDGECRLVTVEKPPISTATAAFFILSATAFAFLLGAQ